MAQNDTCAPIIERFNMLRFILGLADVTVLKAAGVTEANDPLIVSRKMLQKKLQT